ncbi:unnamed protein product [Rhizoctonia solani]|uniref:WD40 repeat-like protein n=1 Tax=Rhizoctonia solani TaxID=456999 RepID=A0A8H3DK97_9AGAM|nr:unnamed protein product [Rhizoctonia solani]
MDEEARFGETEYGISPSSLPMIAFGVDSSTRDHGHNDFSRRRRTWTLARENEDRIPFPEHGPTSLDVSALNTDTGPPNSPTAPSPSHATASGSHAPQGEKRFAKQAKAVRAGDRKHAILVYHLTFGLLQGLFQKYVEETRDFLVDSDVPKLRTLLSAQLPSQHIGQVGHLQFSPDGQHLATCSWDRTAYVWKVDDGASMEFKVIGRLVHPGMPDVVDVGRVAWSPTGDQLLTIFHGSIALWNPLKNAYYQKHLVRRQHVQSVIWMPLSTSFLSAEWQVSSADPEAEDSLQHTPALQGSVLVKFDTTGRQLDNNTHVLDCLQVWDLAVMPDETRVVVVASLIQSRKKYKPINASHQKRILIYNLDTKQIESQMPLMLDVRGVVLGKSGNIYRALVSYENNAPQTWHIDQGNKKCQLKLMKKRSRAYATELQPPMEFAGISYFGTLGKDTLVLAASRAGEIYFWDPPSGNLIHTHAILPTQELIGLARNPQSTNNKFMIASAMHDGTVSIWTTTPESVSTIYGNQFNVEPQGKRPEANEPLRSRVHSRLSQSEAGHKPIG